MPTEGIFLPHTRLEEALAWRRRLNAPVDDVAATLEALGRVLSLTGRYAQAQALLEEANAFVEASPARRQAP